MPRLIAAVCAICLMSACGSGPPTAPTTITQSRTSSPTGNSGGGPDAIAAASVAAGTLVEGRSTGTIRCAFETGTQAAAAGSSM
jgi:hypothetical protein